MGSVKEAVALICRDAQVFDLLSKELSVFDWSWDFDGLTRVVVGVAKLVSELLDVLGTRFRIISKHSVVGRSRYSLSGRCADKEELMESTIYDRVVYDCTSIWRSDLAFILNVLELDLLVDCDEDDINLPIWRYSLASSPNLLIFSVENSKLLRFSHTISIDDDSLCDSSYLFLEGRQNSLNLLL